jgi:hypothetical protein
MAATSTPLIPFEAVLEPAPTPNGIADDHSLLKIDQELDLLLERIEDEIEEKRETTERQLRQAL